MTKQLDTNNIDMSKPKRVKPLLKWSVMLLSVLTLSLLFEGWRQIRTALTVEHLALLFIGIFGTAVLLWLQAFWIYIEEKSKSTLKKKIVHFDRLQEYLEKRGRHD
jgi:hypothetical protein